MNITELRYLVAIKKWGSVSAAAKQLYAAQPNVSKALKNLEEEYGLLDEPPPLLSGDHAGGRALKDADAVFLFQILQRLAHIGLGRIQLLCRRAHGAPLADGHQITQFRNIHVTAPCSKNHSYFIKPGGRLSSQMRLTRPAQSFIIKMLYLQKGV